MNQQPRQRRAPQSKKSLDNVAKVSSLPANYRRQRLNSLAPPPLAARNTLIKQTEKQLQQDSPKSFAMNQQIDYGPDLIQAFTKSIATGEVKQNIEDGLAALKAKYQNFKKSDTLQTVNSKAAFNQIHNPELSVVDNESSKQSDSVSNSSTESQIKINSSAHSPETVSKATRGSNSRLDLNSLMMRTPPRRLEESSLSVNEKNE